jgi:hypothetical protein
MGVAQCRTGPQVFHFAKFQKVPPLTAFTKYWTGHMPGIPPNNRTVCRTGCIPLWSSNARMWRWLHGVHASG